MTEFCKTQQRYTGIACQGLEKGHDGEHNWPPVRESRPDLPIPISELTLDEKLDIVAEAIKRDVETWMLTAVDNPQLLDAAVSRARSPQHANRSLKIFAWGHYW